MTTWIQTQMAQLDRAGLERLCERYYNTITQMEFELEDKCAPALGYAEDPEFGWVVGDHTGMSLFDELLAEFNRLKAANATLSADLLMAEREGWDLARTVQDLEAQNERLQDQVADLQSDLRWAGEELRELQAELDNAIRNQW